MIRDVYVFRENGMALFIDGDDEDEAAALRQVER